MAKFLENKNANDFNCFICKFKTSNKFNYNKHLMTSKHNKLILANSKMQSNNIKSEFFCLCGKKYQHQSSLCKHKKKCNFFNNINDNENNIECEIIQHNEDNIDYKSLFLGMVQENKEFKELLKKQQEQISELIPKVGNNNINSNNKFNINLFLNEKCKDAMSMQEFLKNLDITLKNLLTTKHKGIGSGINEIITENINKLSIYERPIHCTDKKRETLYIKNDKWEKDIDKSATTKMLKDLQLKQIKSLKLWINEHPNYQSDPDINYEYMKLVNKCTSSLNEHEKKLFKSICTDTYLKHDSLLENK